VPGVFASGINDTPGGALGLDPRVGDALFRFLLSAPIIFWRTSSAIVARAIWHKCEPPWLSGARNSGGVRQRLRGYTVHAQVPAHHGLAVFAAYRIVVVLVILMIGLR